MDYESALSNLGLGKNDIKVYVSLLQKPDRTIVQIAKDSGVHRVNVYDAIASLQQYGLVTEINKSGKKVHRAADPKQLTTILDKKREQLNAALPQLTRFHEQAENQVQVYEGIQGIKLIINDLTDTGQPIKAFGIPKELPDRLAQFLEGFHRKRIAKQIPILHIYNENAQERIKMLKEIAYSDARYLPPEYSVPATTLIYGDKTAFWIWSEEPFSLVVESKKMAGAYAKYFDLLWSLAK